MSSQSPRVSLWIIIGSVLLFAATGVVIGPSEVASQPSGEANETTPPHINPAEIEQSGDIEQLAAVLQVSLDESLTRSLRDLDEEEYQEARTLLEEEYEADLDRYREVATELDREEQAELYRLAKTDQAAFVAAVEEFETTEQAYEEARREGDSQRARSLGRQLVTTADRVNNTGENTVTAYQQLETETGRSYTEQINTTDSTRAEIETANQAVVDAEFVETTLTASADQSSVSFTDSLSITGALQTVDNQPLPDQEIQLQINGKKYSVEPAADGEFSLSIQPDSVWETDVSPIEIQYLPTEGSVYLGSQATVSVEVQTTATNVNIQSNRAVVAHDTPVLVNGSVTAPPTDQGVPSTPVALQIDTMQIATAGTTRSGQFQLQEPIPPTLPAGETIASVEVQSSGSALESSRSSVPLTIQPTNTTTTVTASVVEQPSSDQIIRINGTVIGKAGRPVAAMPVAISSEGTTLTEAETTAAGEFTGEVSPSDLTASETVSLTATFDPSNSHLQSSSTTTSISVPAGAPPSGSSGSSQSGIIDTILAVLPGGIAGILLIGVVVVAGIGGLLGFIRWQRNAQTDTKSSDPSPSDNTTSVDSDPPVGSEMLSRAADALENDAYTSATTLAYTAVRRHLSPDVAVDDSATHREWNQACQAANVADPSQLDALVEAFEYVVYAPTDDETPATASTALAAAEELLNFDYDT